MEVRINKKSYGLALASKKTALKVKLAMELDRYFQNRLTGHALLQKGCSLVKREVEYGDFKYVISL